MLHQRDRPKHSGRGIRIPRESIEYGGSQSGAVLRGVFRFVFRGPASSATSVGAGSITASVVIGAGVIEIGSCSSTGGGARSSRRRAIAIDPTKMRSATSAPTPIFHLDERCFSASSGSAGG